MNCLTLDGFDLYREAKEQYSLLIPNKVQGLILLTLFEKFEGKEFSENSIIEVIEKVNKDFGNNSPRTEYERNNSIIVNLQEFFLWRDEGKKVYGFKKYGEDFCKRIQKRIVETYNPAKIKRVFDYLYAALQESVSNSDGDFNQWFEDHFDPRHNELAEQVEILDRQVGESVKNFRSSIRNETHHIYAILLEVESNLEIIKEHAFKLKDAFKITYDIDDILTEILERQNAMPYIENIQRVRIFNDMTRSHLEQVSKRIDRIKPRIREFIYEFNQRDFDRKTQMFLSYLLKYSTYEKRNGREVLFPPKFVPSKTIRNDEFLPIFKIIPIRRIGSPLPIEIRPKIINRQKQQELVLLTNAKIYEKERILFWTKHAFDKLDKDGILDFSPLFFQIMMEENSNLAIAVKTALHVMKQGLKIETVKVKVLKELYSNNLFPSTTLWKMKMAKI